MQLTLANASLAERLARLPQDARADLLAQYSDDEVAGFEYDWSFWGRPSQQPPEGNWRVWMLLAGRGFGKTRTGAEWIKQQEKAGHLRIALVAPTAADVRDTMVEGETGILSVYPDSERPIYEPSKRRIVWKSGATAGLFSADQPERLRGPQHSCVWCDEVGCLIAGTKIATANGQVNIEDIRIGDLVRTRTGFSKVIQAGITRHDAPLWCLTLSSGQSLVGTAYHPVFVPGRDFIALRSVPLGVTLETCEMSSSGTANGGIWERITTAIAAVNCSIAKSTKSKSARFRRAIISTIRTVIRQTGSPIIWWLYRYRNTYQSILGESRFGVQSAAAAILSRCGSASNLVFAYVLTAARNFYPRECAPNSAISIAAWQILGGAIQSQRRNVGVVHQSPALFVERNSALTTRERFVAPRNVVTSTEAKVVSVRSLGIRAPVYNLEVEDDHEYYANGILVHNSWRYPAAWDMLMFGLRLGDDPRAVVTTTPRPTGLIRALIKDPNTVITRGSSYENRVNLAPAFFTQITRKYEGTRLGRQELEAELLEDTPGALWSYETLDATRWPQGRTLPDLVRIVVAIDPAATSGEYADDTGIVVAGKDIEGHAYVLAEASGQMSPQEWAKAAIAAYRAHRADRIVAERNNGGEMVAHTIRAVWPEAPVTEVWASRGKVTRAEPVAALYERGRVHHLGAFPELEDQMCLAQGTLIDTARGMVPVECIGKGDQVRTRTGFYPVKFAGKTGRSSEFVDLKSMHGEQLRCTPSHPILNATTGQFVPAKFVQPGMCLNVRQGAASTVGQLRIADVGIGAIRKAITTIPILICSSAKFGAIIAGRFLQKELYTIATKIRATTSLITCVLSRLASTVSYIPIMEASSIGMQKCIANIPGGYGRRESGARSFARIAVKKERRLGVVSESSVIIAANKSINRFLEWPSDLVRNVAARSVRETRDECIAVASVMMLRTTPESVYNLEVDGPPEYYANGILVHNCAFTIDFDRKEAGYSPDRVDALVWAITDLLVDPAPQMWVPAQVKVVA